MIEVEVKVQISDPSSLRQEFEKQGGIYKLSLIHEDTYYNMPKGLRNLAFTDEALRIRNSIEFSREEKKRPKSSICYFTYKGKKVDKVSKSRKEVEVVFDDAKSLKEILSVLGFREIFTVKKERELYEFEYKDNRIEALIDYLPILKTYFLEVEIIAESIEQLEEKRDLLFNFLYLFGYSKYDSIRESYLELILKKK